MTIIPIIGLEVHVELKTKSKMFCACDAHHFHAQPNTHTCPVCLGLPGALPVPNKTAIDWCLKLGLALGCTINKHSFFERKNYFYPDLPKGYQISQYQQPFCVNGKLGDVRINRVHLEEDTGKSVHVAHQTQLDFNRCGVPLVEIVSEPDLISPQEVKKYLAKIQQIVRYLNISDADIEKGSMRCEPTVNLNIDQHFTPLVEIKNIASLTGALNAIQYEIDRQTEQYAQNHLEKSPDNKTTRGWDADKNQTFIQREKEGSADYRYFPEPDIPTLEFSDELIESIRATLPQLPDQKIAKYKSWGLSDYDAQLLADNQDFAAAFEKAVGSQPSPDFAKFVTNLFIGPLKKTGISIDKITPIYFKNLFDRSSDLSSTSIKQLIIESYRSGQDPLVIAQEKNLFQLSDTAALEAYARQTMAANPKVVANFQKNPKVIGFLVGQLMKLSRGSANPQLAHKILEKLLLKNNQP